MALNDLSVIISHTSDFNHEYDRMMINGIPLFENQLLKVMERLLCCRNYTEMNGHSQEKSNLCHRTWK